MKRVLDLYAEQQLNLTKRSTELQKELRNVNQQIMRMETEILEKETAHRIKECFLTHPLLPFFPEIFPFEIKKEIISFLNWTHCDWCCKPKPKNGFCFCCGSFRNYQWESLSITKGDNDAWLVSFEDDDLNDILLHVKHQSNASNKPIQVFFDSQDSDYCDLKSAKRLKIQNNSTNICFCIYGSSLTFG